MKQITQFTSCIPSVKSKFLSGGLVETLHWICFENGNHCCEAPLPLKTLRNFWRKMAERISRAVPKMEMH